MDIATKPTVEIRELEIDGQLLRFVEPLSVEVDSDQESCSLDIPALGLGIVGRDESEAWEMLAELVIANYLDYRKVAEAPKYPLARKQWHALRTLVHGYYLRQPA